LANPEKCSSGVEWYQTVDRMKTGYPLSSTPLDIRHKDQVLA